MKPLAFMQTNWREFIEMSQDILGLSPTRGLDEGLFPKHNDPAAILACLDFENKPQEAMLKAELHKHFFMSMIGELNKDEILLLTKYTNLSIYHKGRHERFIVIASGTLNVWLDAIDAKCDDYRFKKVQADIHQQCCILGFKPLMGENNDF